MGAANRWLFKTGNAALVGRVYFHDIQRETGAMICYLVTRLQTLKSVEDWFPFQKELSAMLYAAEEREYNATQALKASPGDLDRQVEEFASGRAVRQLRSVGDAFAWLVLGMERAAVVALSQNRPSGRIYGKAGYAAEVEAVEAYWETMGHFALLHDLTNCLRIHDLTVVNHLHRAGAPDHTCGEAAYDIVEVKTGRGRGPSPRQQQRIADALQAINEGGPLIGPDGHFQQFRPKIAFSSHQQALAGLLEAAMSGETGTAAIVVEDGWVASALRLPGHKVGTDIGDLVREWNRARAGALADAGLKESSEVFRLQTGDAAGRALFRIPFGLFPIPPRTASFLSCDWLIYDSLLSPTPLEDALRHSGVTVARTAGPALVITHGDHSIEVTRRSIEPALHEMITVGTMADALAEWVRQPGFTGQGQLVFPNAPYPTFAAGTSSYKTPSN